MASSVWLYRSDDVRFAVGRSSCANCVCSLLLTTPSGGCFDNSDEMMLSFMRVCVCVWVRHIGLRVRACMKCVRFVFF